jgi:cytochrome c-type biogenesis protein CcmH
VGEPALRRRRAVSTLALSAIPLIALAVYGALGSPTLPSQTQAERQAADPGRLDLNAALVRIEAHLAANPNDGRGWEVVAPVYLRLGRADEAARAYRAALRHLGETAPRLSALGEALVVAGDGVVSAEARSAFEGALKQDPDLPKARYYLALAAEQDGRADEARRLYQALVNASPADAPWLGSVRERLARLDGPQLSVGADQRAAIEGMVEGLAGRLTANGGSALEWSRLVRSYVVLGQRDKALAALRQGEAALAQDAAGRETLRAAAREAGLPVEGAP